MRAIVLLWPFSLVICPNPPSTRSFALHLRSTYHTTSLYPPFYFSTSPPSCPSTDCRHASSLGYQEAALRSERPGKMCGHAPVRAVDAGLALQRNRAGRSPFFQNFKKGTGGNSCAFAVSQHLILYNPAWGTREIVGLYASQSSNPRIRPSLHCAAAARDLPPSRAGGRESC